MSLEQTQDFHQIRRLVKIVAPEYRVVATDLLKADESALDVRKKTIEVSELVDVRTAALFALFEVGHAILSGRSEYQLLYGANIGDWAGAEDDLVEQLAGLGVSADAFAKRWASDMYEMTFSPDDTKHQEILKSRSWSHSRWREYFSQ